MAYRTYKFTPQVIRGNGKPSVFLAFDVENNPVDGKFILASVCGELRDHHNHIQRINQTFMTQEGLQAYFMSLREVGSKQRHPCTLVAFNAAYDVGFLSEIEDTTKRLDAGGRFISTTLKNGLKVIDLGNFLTGSLKVNVETFRSIIPSLKKTPLDVTDKELLKVHCEEDAKATYELINFLSTYYTTKGLQLNLTKAGLALQSFRKYNLSKVWKCRNEDVNEFERRAYYGGRTEVFIHGDDIETTSFDVNSMYPSRCVNEPLPDPTSLVQGTGDSDTFREFFKDTDMVIECTVEVPYQHVPPLPYHGVKLLFPYGKLTGVWCTPELRYAIDECNCKLVEVKKWIAYRRKTTDLKDYMISWYNERLEWRKQKNKAMETLSKYFLNSLTGKFGEHVIGNQIIDIEDIGITKEQCEGLPMFETDNGVFVHIKDEGYESTDHTFPVIIAFITAYARVHLHKAMCSVGKDLVYCDTDSVHCLTRSAKRFIGLNWISDRKEDLGAWSNEGEHINSYYRPKFYGNHLKGVNLERSELISENENERVYAFKRPYKRREAIRRNKTINQWVWHEKIVNKADTKRVWQKDGSSEPIRMKT